MRICLTKNDNIKYNKLKYLLDIIKVEESHIIKVGVFMKKVLVFLSILMLSFSGVLFACNEDRYADLKVVLTSITSESGRDVTYNADGNYYEVYYGDKITITASISSSSDVSRDVVFSSSSENFPRIENTVTSNSATFSADMPSQNETFRVVARSRETNRGELSLYFRVLLPTSEINLKDNLGVMTGYNVDLNSEVEFYSDLGTSYQPDERGVSFTIDSYFDGDVTYSVEEREGVYYVSGSAVPSFDLENGVLEVLDSSLDGSIRVTAKSEKYDDDLEDFLASSNLTEEQKQEYRDENNRLIDTEDIDIVMPITLDDIVITGGQIGFQNYRDTVAGNKVVKLNASLYNNELSEYQIGGIDYSYNFETLNVMVDSAEDIDIDYLIGDMVFNGETFVSQNNVLNISEAGSGKNKTFTVYSNNAGTAYLDFVFNYGFDNDISYSFGDMYSEYLEGLTTSEYDALEDYEKYNRLVFNVSLVSDLISVSQDGEVILRAEDESTVIDTDSLTIFDSYSGTKNQNGSLFEVSLSSRTGVLDENKIVRVYLKGQTSEVVSDYIVVRNANGIQIELSTIEIDEETNYYFDLDLSDNFNRSFYLKAKEEGINASFVLKFENLITHEILTREGEVTGSIQGESVDSIITTTKGVETIEVKAISGGNEFVNLDDANLSDDPTYQKLVLGVGNQNGTLIAYFFDDDVEGDIEVSGYDESVISIATSDDENSNLFGYFDGALETGLKIGGVIAFRGLRVGETTITFTAEKHIILSVKANLSLPLGRFGGASWKFGRGLFV